MADGTDWTAERAKVTELLAQVTLRHGLGTAAEPCSVAAIHIALTGRVTDGPHPCMSNVVRRWVIRVQDAMPVELLNRGTEHGDRWQETLPLLVGSAAGKDVEAARLETIVHWMWDRLGGDTVPGWVPGEARQAWATMLAERTEVAATDATDATDAAIAADATDAAIAARAARAANAATAAIAADAAIAAIAARAANVYAANAADALRVSWWTAADPAGLLALLLQGDVGRG